MARGDGTTTISGKLSNPLGPDSNAWKRVLNTLDEVILLNVPLSLCRARCLQRRVKSTPINLLDTVIEATDQHYSRNDAVTYKDIIECDILRATIIVDVPSLSEINDTMNPRDAIKVLSHIQTSSFFAGAFLRFMND
jgi:S-adenosylmethionine:diacylglycerol 3-amino-3-carboxypropyl transferase